jgi:Transcriptional regulator
MVKLKDKIRETAKRLFTEKGYDAVSLRAVAEEAGTTIGNLTYHYRQKEDLIAAIQKDSQANFIIGLEGIPDQPRDVLRHLCLMAERTQAGHAENPFYFRNIIEMCANFPSIRENTVSFRKKIYNAYLECFDKLRGGGVMRTDIPVTNYNNLAYMMVILATLWTQNASPHDDDNLPHSSLAESILALVYPYLTPEGVALLREVRGL